MKAKALLILILLFCCTQLAASEQGDALDEALALVGMRRADLGWEPKGWWPRFPVAPYKLRAFDALFAAPLDSITFTRALAATAWEKLDPAGLDARDERGSGNLFQAVQRLGIDPKFGGFRGYTANIIAPETDLDAAVMVVDRDRQGLLGAFLSHHVFVEELADLARLADPQALAQRRASSRTPVGLPVFLDEDRVAEVDALVADVDVGRAGHQRVHHVPGLPAEGATLGVALSTALTHASTVYPNHSDMGSSTSSTSP